MLHMIEASVGGLGVEGQVFPLETPMRGKAFRSHDFPFQVIVSRGGRFLEAPVSGNQQLSNDGMLVILAAGDRGLYEDCSSCFQAMGKTSFFLGNMPAHHRATEGPEAGWATSPLDCTDDSVIPARPLCLGPPWEGFL